MLSHFAQLVPPLLKKRVLPLRTLDIHFTVNDYGAQPALERLAAFTNLFTATLRSLSISSIAHLDFSPLYAQLDPFPKLSSLSLVLPCDPRHVPDPSALNSFLTANAGLDSLDFTPQYCCHESSLPPRPVRPAPVSLPSLSSSPFSLSAFSTPSPPASPASSLSTSPTSTISSPLSPPQTASTTVEWLDMAFRDISYPQLSRLELGLNILGSGGKKVLPVLPRIASSWAQSSTGQARRHLVINGSFTNEEDLRTLLTPFSEGTGVTLLEMETQVLSVGLLAVIARLLPGLKQLDLVYRWIGAVGGVQESQFVAALGEVNLGLWGLESLDLRCSRQQEYSEPRWPCQKAIMDRIRANR